MVGDGQAVEPAATEGISLEASTLLFGLSTSEPKVETPKAATIGMPGIQWSM